MPKEIREKLEFLKREEIKTMAKDVAKLRELAAIKEREKIGRIPSEAAAPRPMPELEEYPSDTETETSATAFPEGQPEEGEIEKIMAEEIAARMMAEQKYREDKERRMASEIKGEKKRLEREREEMEKELLFLPDQRTPLQEKKDVLLAQIQEIERTVEPLEQEKAKIDKQKKTIETQEKETLSGQEKRKIEGLRWEVEEKRHQIEQAEWEKEQQTSELRKKLKDIDLEFRKLALREENIKERLTKTEGRQREVRLEEDRLALKDKLAMAITEREELGVKTQELLQTRYQIEKALAEILEAEKAVEQEIDSLEKEEAAAKSLSDKSQLGQRRWPIEKERRRIEQERWQKEEERSKIEPQIKEVQARYHQLINQETEIRKEFEDVESLLGKRYPARPESAARREPGETPAPEPTEAEKTPEQLLKERQEIFASEIKKRIEQKKGGEEIEKKESETKKTEEIKKAMPLRAFPPSDEKKGFAERREGILEKGLKEERFKVAPRKFMGQEMRLGPKVEPIAPPAPEPEQKKIEKRLEPEYQIAREKYPVPEPHQTDDVKRFREQQIIQKLRTEAERTPQVSESEKRELEESTPESAEPKVLIIPAPSSTFEKVLLRLTLFLAFAAIFIFIVTFWFFYYKNPELPSTPPEQPTPEETPPEEELTLPPAISIDTFESFFITTSTDELSGLLSTALQNARPDNYFTKLSITNQPQNQILGLKEFFQALGVTAPDKFYSALNNDSTLFIYSYAEATSTSATSTPSKNILGLVTPILNKDLLLQAMAQWELTIIPDAKGLFELYDEWSETAVASCLSCQSFNDLTFKGVTFHYRPLHPIADFGIAWAIKGDYFLYTLSQKGMTGTINNLIATLEEQ